MNQPRYFHNLSQDDPCEVCFNEGWVVIKGYYQVYGYSYSNGSAPCKWCELGHATFDQAKKRKIKPRTPVTDRYTIDMVDGYDPDAEYFPKAEVARLIKELIAGHHQQPYEQQDAETRRLVELQVAARDRNYAPPPREDIRP